MRRLSLPLLLLLTAASAQSRAQDEIKTPSTPPYLDDFKPLAPVLTKADAPAQAAEPVALPESFPEVKLPEPIERARQSGRRTPARVHIDRPDGDALWAHGGTYKARFDTGGAMYVPFFGSDAPRNYPVSFLAPTITVGGSEIVVDSAAAPTLEGRTVLFDRGAVTEVYDVRLGELEQLFVLDAPLGTGDLVVRTPIETELVSFQTADHLEFSNAFGRVEYTRAVAIDADGRRASVPTELANGEIVITVPASFLAGAAYPLTIDPVVTTMSIDSSTFNDYYPDVAYDETNDIFVVVWEQYYSSTDHDMWFEAWTPSGNPVVGFDGYIDYTLDCWRQPRIAGNNLANQFLVVANTSANCSGDYAIEGRSISANDGGMGSQFRIDGGQAGSKYQADVGGDSSLSGPTYYMVTYERRWSDTDGDVHAQLVDTNSSRVGGTIYIENDTDNQRRPRISKTNGHAPSASQAWTITWMDEWSASDWDIFAAQVDWDGTVVTPAFTVDFSSANHSYPAVSTILDGGTGPRPYMVAYQAGAFPRDIRSTVLRGTSVLDRATLTDIDGSNPAQDHRHPSLDSDGSQFTLIYSETYSSSTTDYDVYISTFYLSANDIRVAEGHQNVAFSVDAERDPKICSIGAASATSGSRRFMGVWHDGPIAGGAWDIEGAIYDSPSPFDNDVGSSFCGPAFPNSSGSGASIAASGSATPAGPLRLAATGMPSNEFGYFLTSQATGTIIPIGSQGVLCLGLPIGRFNGAGQIRNSGASGTFSLDVDPSTLPMTPPQPALAGETWHFQAWFRDHNPSLTSNFTDAVSVTFH